MSREKSKENMFLLAVKAYMNLPNIRIAMDKVADELGINLAIDTFYNNQVDDFIAVYDLVLEQHRSEDV